MLLEQQISIIMFPEVSWDTRDWSIDAENSALHHRNKFRLIKYIQIENSYVEL